MEEGEQRLEILGNWLWCLRNVEAMDEPPHPRSPAGKSHSGSASSSKGGRVKEQTTTGTGRESGSGERHLAPPPPPPSRNFGTRSGQSPTSASEPNRRTSGALDSGTFVSRPTCSPPLSPPPNNPPHPTPPSSVPTRQKLLGLSGPCSRNPIARSRRSGGGRRGWSWTRNPRVPCTKRVTGTGQQPSPHTPRASSLKSERQIIMSCITPLALRLCPGDTFEPPPNPLSDVHRPIELYQSPRHCNVDLSHLLTRRMSPHSSLQLSLLVKNHVMP